MARGGVSSEITSDEGGSLLDPDGFLHGVQDKTLISKASESLKSSNEHDHADYTSN